MANRWGIVETVTDFTLGGGCSKITENSDCKLKDTWKKRYDKPGQHIKRQRHHFGNKGLNSQSYSFPSGHVQTWELNYKEDWVPMNWSFWTVVLEKTVESPLDSKDIKLVNTKGNQSWIFIARTDAEAETPILWPPEQRVNSLEKPWCWEILMASLLFSAISKPSSKTILTFCISFSWGWSWLLPPVQSHEPLSIVLQGLCLLGLISWISFSFPLYNHQEFDLYHIWIV